MCHDFKISHPGQVVNTYNFCRLFSKAWVESMTDANITVGFQTTGVYPINREAVMQEGCLSRAEESSLKPLSRFTPLKHSTVQCSLSSADGESFKSCLSSSCSPSEDSCLSRRQNALINIVDLKTPQIKTQSAHLPSDRVLTSLECCQNMKKKAKEQRGTTQSKGA